EDSGIDADHFPAEVEGRAAGIAAVHRRVHLQVVVIGAGADIAAARRDDAGRDRAAEAERIADRHDPVADADLVIVGKADIGELALVLLVDLEDGEVRAAVLADERGAQLRTVVHDDGEGRAVVDDMVVGDDVAVFGDEETGALGGRAQVTLAVASLAAIAEAPVRAAVAMESVLAAEFTEETLQGMVVGQVVEATAAEIEAEVALVA